MTNELYGAKALVYLKYSGDIKTLANKLSIGLVIPEFSVEKREEAPHDLVGSCEAFGLEAWLEASNKIDGFGYSFEMQTEHSLEENFNDRMHDLSLWLARYIFSICKIEVLVAGSDGQGDIIFS